MSLYQKYRPETFDGMFGNKQSIKSLRQLMEKEDRPHVYLFTGPAGCGKTTAARICVNMLGGTIRELNSSNNRGIDTAREIIDNIRYVSMDGKPIIYIMDEVHKSTNDFQNAMLKSLEDVPEHVYFILCTTNPEKLIKPLKSRCTKIIFNTLDYEEIVRLLRAVNRKEKENVSLELIEDIADNCEGSPRNALVLFEQIIGLDEKEASKIISKGYVGENKSVLELCRILLKRENWGEVKNILNDIDEDVEKVRWAVMGYMSKVLLDNKNVKAALILEYFSEPFYNSGKNGLILACFQSFFAK